MIQPSTSSTTGWLGRATDAAFVAFGVGLLVLGIGLFAPLAAAQPPGGHGQGYGKDGFRHRGFGPGDRGPGEVAEFLGLSDEQEAAWKAVHEKSRDRMRPIFEEMHSVREELRAAVESESPDPTAVGQLFLQSHRLMEQVRELHEQTEQELVALLTEEQKVRYEAFREANGPFGGRGSRHGRHGDFGDRDGDDGGLEPPG